MRIALIGYGAVASLHARKLQKIAEVVTIYGPNREKAEIFAEQHGIRQVGADLKSTLEQSDAVVICSPSSIHYEQAENALLAGAHVLVEFPACVSSNQVRELGALALERGLILRCAHTSRHLDPYRRIKSWLNEGTLGQIRHIHYVRSITPRNRSWTDDALWHHAGHPIDLLLDWFGSLRPLGCAAYPRVPEAQNVSLVACTSEGVPIAISVSYESRLPETKMTVIGSKHTIATDGFSYVASDDSRFTWRGNEQHVYERAIEEQDSFFLKACNGAEAGTPWNETIRLGDCITQFVNLWNCH